MKNYLLDNLGAAQEPFFLFFPVLKEVLGKNWTTVLKIVSKQKSILVLNLRIKNLSPNNALV